VPCHLSRPPREGQSALFIRIGSRREILECWFAERPIREEYLIVDGGKLAGAGAHSYSAGDATGGADEAARFKAG
jgi:formate dehydrogenase